jgi:hypothetical protein
MSETAAPSVPLVLTLPGARRALLDNDWRALTEFMKVPEIAAAVWHRATSGNEWERECMEWTARRASGQLDGATELRCRWDGGLRLQFGHGDPDTIACITGLPNVRNVHAAGSLKVLATLPALHTLAIYEVAADAECLAEMRNLRVLQLDEEPLGYNPREEALLRYDAMAPTRRAALLESATRVPLEELTIHTCTAEDLAIIGRMRSLHTLHIRELHSDALEPLRDHPALRTLEIAQKADRPIDASTLGSVATLEDVHVAGPVASLAWVRGSRLRALRLSGDAEITPLQGLTTLQILQIEGTVPDLAPLEGLIGLSVLHVKAARGAAVIATLKGLTEANLAIGDATFQLVADLAELPHLQFVRMDPHPALAPYPVCWGCGNLRSAASYRSFVSAFRAARLPRTLPAVEALSKEETAALRTLNAAFKAARVSRDAVPAIQSTPMRLLTRICGHAGVCIDAYGELAWNQKGLRFPRVTQANELILALADAVGLLDGLTYFSAARSSHLRYLGALKRHADTLKFLYVDPALTPYAERTWTFSPRAQPTISRQWWFDEWPDGIVVGESMQTFLSEFSPMPAIEAGEGWEQLATGSPSLAQASADAAPAEIEKILQLLYAPDDAGAQQGAELAAALDQVDTLLEGCSAEPWALGKRLRLTPTCIACGGSGRRGAGTCRICEGRGSIASANPEAAARIVPALLAAAPRRSETAVRVLQALRRIDLNTTVPLWLHHARALQRVSLTWAVLREHVDTLARLPALREVVFAAAEPDAEDAALLARLPQVVVYTFENGATTRLLGALGEFRVQRATLTRR